MYSCERCGYISDRLSNLKNHLSKVNICRDKLNSGKSVDELIYELSKSKQKQTIIEILDEKNKIIKSLSEENKKLSEENKKLNNRVEELEKKITNNIEIHGNNNSAINNNINIVLNFGSENIKYIEDDKEFLNKLFKNLSSSMPKLTEAIYCNDLHPENKTVKIRNFKENQLLIHTDGKWVNRSANDVIPDMIHKQKNILTRHYFDSPELKREDIEELNNSNNDYLISLIDEDHKNNKKAFSSIKSIIRN